MREKMRPGSGFRKMLIYIAAVALTACSGNRGGSSQEGNEREITVSVAPLAYFAKAIGGDSVKVRTLLPAGTDPETFQPGMDAMRALNRGGVLAVTGVLPFESEMTEKLKANNADLQLADAGKGIELIYGTHMHAHAEHGEAHEAHEAGDAHEHGEGEPDPHIWGSVKNARIIAGNLHATLCGLYPELRPYFTSRYEELDNQLDSIDRAYAVRLEMHPAFVIWHPSLSYFARDYGLEQISFNIENKETSPLRLREATDHALTERPAAFFVPQGLNPERVRAIATSLSLEPTEVNFMSEEWLSQMNLIVDHLTADQR